MRIRLPSPQRDLDAGLGHAAALPDPKPRACWPMPPHPG